MPQILTVEAHEAFWDLKVTWQRPSLAPLASLCLSPWLSLQNDSSLFPFVRLLHFLFRLASLFTYDPAWPYLNNRQTLGLVWLALQSCLTLFLYFKQHSRRSDLIFQPGQLSPPGPLNCGFGEDPYQICGLTKRRKEKKVKSLSCVQLFATPWTIAYHAPSSMGFSRQEYWSGLPFPSPGDLPLDRTQGLNPGLLNCRQTLYHLSHQGSHQGKQGEMWDNWLFHPGGSHSGCFTCGETKAQGQSDLLKSPSLWTVNSGFVPCSVRPWAPWSFPDCSPWPCSLDTQLSYSC